MSKSLSAIAVAVLAAFAGPVFAQDGGLDIPTVPLVPPDAEGMSDRADPAGFDISGVWEYATSNHTVSGICNNPGSAMSGLLEIAASGGDVSLTLVSGAICNPGWVCAYTGGIEDHSVIVSNTGTVDDEGGEVTNALQLIFVGQEAGFGRGGSYYLHPEGYQCQWSYEIFFHRPDVEGDTWTPGVSESAD